MLLWNIRPRWPELVHPDRLTVLLVVLVMRLAAPDVLSQTLILAPHDPETRILQPRIFAPGMVSTDMDESGGAFSPDGKDFYFAVLAPYTTAPRFGMICVSHFRDGHWQKPETVSFSGMYLDFAPRLSSDGNKLYFSSVRPSPESKAPRLRIWVAERSGNGWTDPVPVPAPINQETSHNLDASLSPNGDMFFASDRDDPARHLHIFHARFVDGRFQQPEKLGPEINSEFSESAPAISPDGKMLVFASNAAPEDPERRRPQDLIAAGKPYPRQDLYISINRNGQWTPARHLDHGINSFAEEAYPNFSPDGKLLFWSSERSVFNIPTKPLKHSEVEKLWHSSLNGRGNIYFIRVEALEAER